MKTGELLLKINKKDLKLLLGKISGIEYNRLSPFAPDLKENQTPLMSAQEADMLLSNSDIVYLLKNLFSPPALLNIDLVTLDVNLEKLFVSKTGDGTYILVVFDGECYSIQYYEDKKVLSDIISSFLISQDNKGGEDSFPAILNFESLVMFLNIIDSYKYINYRDALNHDNSQLMKITTDEFGKLIKDSLQQFSVNWFLSKMMFLIPSLSKFTLKGDKQYYDEFFAKGYLQAARDKTTEKDYILLGSASQELGSEFSDFLNKTAGIQISFLKNDAVETVPLAFIANTTFSNHCFIFSENTDEIRYLEYVHGVTDDIFSVFIDKLILHSIKDEAIIKSDKEEVKAKFCGNCGTKVVSEARFCPKCGNKY